MMSLLNISSEQIYDAKLKTKLEDITRRMQSMAIIHQQFYESEDMARIDFAVFLRQLLDSLKSGYPGIADKATAVCATGEVFVNLDQAVPAGLIINELLTNAMKFAFADKRSGGKIMLTQRLNDGMLEVEVLDNGVGLPMDLDPRHAQSMGMILIRILTEQLGGNVEFRSGQGTDAVLRFALKGYSTSVLTTPRGIWMK
jgi:two-component sensor histidine kinase